MKPSRPVNGAEPRFEASARANCRAFTFVELLVIVCLLALLVIMQWPALAKARHQTARAQCAANLRQVTTALQIYATENGDKLPAATAGYWACDMPS